MTKTFSRFSDKTRVVITGDRYKKVATEILLHVLNFFEKNIDYITSSAEHLTTNDFVLFESDGQNFLQYRPTLTLITSEDPQKRDAEFLRTITPGGIVIFDDENPTLQKAVSESENFFRKIPYQKAVFHKSEGKTFLETDLGDIPAEFPDENLIFLEGVKLLAQQLGIMEEEFYEAIAEYKR